MKYKFLFNILKSSLEFNIFRDVGDNESMDNMIQETYEYLIHIKVELEKKVERRLFIVDKFLDEIFLTRLINKDNDINKIYKKLTLFIKSCSIDDFRELYLYKLSIYNDLSSPKESYNFPLVFIPYIIISIICGGIIYKPLKLSSGLIISIGNDLDSMTTGEGFLSSKLVNDTMNKMMLDDKEEINFSDLGAKPSQIFKAKAAMVSKLLTKNSCYIYNYLERLLGLYNALYIPSVNEAMGNYITIDMFKLDFGNDLFKDNPDCFGGCEVNPGYTTFVPGYNLECLRNRNYILPKNGVILKVLDDTNDISSFILEGYDDIIGCYICQMKDINDCRVIDLIFMTANVNNIIYPNDCTISLLNLYDVAPIIKRGDEGIEQIDVFNILISSYSACKKDSDAKLEYTSHYMKYKSLEYEVYKPSYWKYKGLAKLKQHNQKELVEKESLLAEKEIKINAFKRKLPKGSSRSKQAEELARKYCLDLKDDETVVSPFERKQKVRLQHLGF